MALCLYHFGVYCDNLGTFYIFHEVLFKLSLWNLCWSFWINKSTSRIYRRKRRYKHILLSKRIGTWIDINHDKFEFYIMFLFGLGTFILNIRCVESTSPIKIWNTSIVNRKLPFSQSLDTLSLVLREGEFSML